MARVSIPLYELPVEYGNPGAAWKRPAPGDQGDATEDAIYLAVGRALSRWELVDNFMARLFATLVNSPSQASARAFGSVVSPQGRREMVENAGEIYFDDPNRHKHDAGVLGKLLKNYGEAASRRNDIAHGIAAEITDGAKPKLGWFLVPPDYNSKRTSPPAIAERAFGEAQFSVGAEFHISRNRSYLKRANYTYTSADIISFTRKFEELGLVTTHFVNNLRSIEEYGDQR